VSVLVLEPLSQFPTTCDFSTGQLCNVADVAPSAGNSCKDRSTPGLLGLHGIPAAIGVAELIDLFHRPADRAFNSSADNHSQRRSVGVGACANASDAVAEAAARQYFLERFELNNTGELQFSITSPLQ
jgi:hypothetical protein